MGAHSNRSQPNAPRRNQTMTARPQPRRYCVVSIDEQLKRELGRHLCAIVDGYNQGEAAAMLFLSQSAISAMRRGDLRGGPSLSRLLRVIAKQRYSVEVHFKYIDARIQRPRPEPTLTGVRYDHFGRPPGQS